MPPYPPWWPPIPPGQPPPVPPCQPPPPGNPPPLPEPLIVSSFCCSVSLCLTSSCQSPANSGGGLAAVRVGASNAIDARTAAAARASAAARANAVAPRANAVAPRAPAAVDRMVSVVTRISSCAGQQGRGALPGGSCSLVTPVSATSTHTLMDERRRRRFRGRPRPLQIREGPLSFALHGPRLRDRTPAIARA